MPEFVQEDLSPYRTIYVHFKNEEDFRAFEKLIGQRIIRYAGGPGTVWFPKAKKIDMSSEAYKDGP